jgi:hypothetical protein
MTPSLPEAETLYAGGYTLYRMRPRQLTGIAERTVRERLLSRLPIDLNARYERRVPTDPTVGLDPIADNTATLRTALRPDTRDRYRTLAREAASGTPWFLTRSVDALEDGSVQWHHETLEDLPYMWSLQLYAFEPLHWLVTSGGPDDESDLRTTFDTWISEWIDTVEIGEPQYLRRKWTPWAVSLRIQRFCRYLGWRRRPDDHGADALDRQLRHEIYKNASFLRNNIERDVDGNHLVENGAALVMAGVLFVDDDHDWLETGVSILRDAAERQFLADGCHFERSPMYHVLVLTRYLTACDLLDRTGRSGPAVLEGTAAAAAGYLRALRPPDDRIPLLNDAIYDVGLPLADCLRYAEAVGVDPTGRHGDPRGPTADSPETAGRLGESGVRWLRTDHGAMLVDGGPVGPPHLPAHAHSDTLQVLLWAEDRPIVTDSGVFDYVPDRRRGYARGVRGHNTVQVGDAEPIPLGGKYLMGPRPEPETRTRRGRVDLFEGTYDARPFGDPGYSHHRAVYASDDWWLVVDTVDCAIDDPVRARYHLHPTVETSHARSNTASSGGPDGLRVAADEGISLHATPLAGTLDQGCSMYYPRFWEALERTLVTLTAEPARPARLAMLFSPDRPPEASLAVDAALAPVRLDLGEESHRLPASELLPQSASKGQQRPD